MKNQQIFLLIAAVVLAGCVGQPGGGGAGGGTAGVVITSFAADSPTVGGFSGSDASGTAIQFLLEVKNVGERTTKNIKAALLGLSNDWTSPTVGTVSPDTLLPADPQTGTEGGTATATWSVTSPKSKATDISYDIGVRVQYDYETIAEGLFRVATPEYLRSITTAGSKPSQTFGIISFKSTGGPLVVTSNMRTSTVPKGGKDVQVQFQIQNTGGGRAFKTTAGDDTITIKGCGTAGDKDVKLFGGKSATAFCTFTTDSVQDLVEKTFTLTITYSYFVDSTTQVTVLKAPIG